MSSAALLLALAFPNEPAVYAKLRGVCLPLPPDRLVAIDGDRRMYVDFPAQFTGPGDDLWRADDGGEIHAEGFNVEARIDVYDRHRLGRRRRQLAVGARQRCRCPVQGSDD
jgi:hypothetical protein